MLSPFIVSGAHRLWRVLKVSLIAELFGARSGLGFQMSLAQDLGRVDTILAICIAIVIFVVAGDALSCARFRSVSTRSAAPQTRRPTAVRGLPRSSTPGGAAVNIRFDGKRVAVSGAARGFGRHIAALCGAGAKVHGCDVAGPGGNAKLGVATKRVDLTDSRAANDWTFASKRKAR